MRGHRLRWRCGLKSFKSIYFALSHPSPPSLAVWIEIGSARLSHIRIPQSPPSLAVWIEMIDICPGI